MLPVTHEHVERRQITVERASLVQDVQHSQQRDHLAADVEFAPASTPLLQVVGQRAVLRVLEDQREQPRQGAVRTSQRDGVVQVNRPRLFRQQKAEYASQIQLCRSLVVLTHSRFGSDRAPRPAASAR